VAPGGVRSYSEISSTCESRGWRDLWACWSDRELEQGNWSKRISFIIYLTLYIYIYLYIEAQDLEANGDVPCLVYHWQVWNGDIIRYIPLEEKGKFRVWWFLMEESMASLSLVVVAQITVVCITYWLRRRFYFWWREVCWHAYDADWTLRYIILPYDGSEWRTILFNLISNTQCVSASRP